MDFIIIPRLRAFLFLCALTLSLASVDACAKTEEEIDASVDAALAQFRNDVKGADDYLNSAKGVLVVPNVKKAGLVIAGQGGEGALRIDGKTVAYYDLSAASLGFQAGYQEANLLFLFLTQEALDQFVASKGWVAGADAGVTVVDVGTGLSPDTLRAKSSVIAFAFGKRGLMAGWSVKGTKLTRKQSIKPASAR